MRKKLKIICLVSTLNIVGIIAYYFFVGKAIGLFFIIACIALSAFLIYESLSDSNSEILTISYSRKERKFINEFTPSNKRMMYLLGWAIAFAPSLYLNSKNLAFFTLFALNVWLIFVFIRNTYSAIISRNFIDVPIKSISVEIPCLGGIQQSRVYIDVKYEYEVNLKLYTCYKIRYPFWFVTDKKKIELSKKIKSNSITRCYVNAKNHKQAVLIKGFELSDLAWFIIYVAFGLMSLLIYLTSK